MKSTSSLAKLSLVSIMLLVAAPVLGFSSLILPSAAGTSSTSTAEASAAGLELSPEPVYEEVSRQVGENPLNDTHVETIFAASGNLTLPNATTGEPIRTTSRGSILISFVDATAIGEQVITTTEGEEGGETAVAKFFGIARFNMEQEGT